MPELKFEPAQLAEAIACHLNYRSLIGQKTLLNEGSLQAPITDYLNITFNGLVRSEVNHPMLRNSGEKGRPNQLDFVVEKRGRKTWDAVLECKFGGADYHRMMRDICRLHCLYSGGIGRPSRYFLYATETDNGKILQNLANTGDGHRVPYFKGILSRKKKRIGYSKEFHLKNLEPIQLRPFREFMRTNNVALQSVVATTLVGLSWSGDFACGIWKIDSVKGSRPIKIEDIRS